MVFKERVKQFLGPRTEWVPAPTEKQITRASRGYVFLLVLTLTVVVFWTMLVMFAERNVGIILFTLGLWAVTVWCSYCGVVEISTMKIARDSANLTERLRKFRRVQSLKKQLATPGQLSIQETRDIYEKLGHLYPEPLNCLQDLEA